MKHLAMGFVLSALLISANITAAHSDPAADRQAVAAASAQFAAAENTGNVEQILAVFADDLVIVGPSGRPLTGADRIAEVMHKFHAEYAVQVEYQVEEVVVSGDWAFDRGTCRYALTPKAAGTPISASCSYLWLYRRHADGSWKQARVMWTNLEPPPAGGT